MIITLKNFNALGRYSYATLKETFDTEKDEIFDKDKKVEINSVVDLFPYLWQTPGVSGFSEGKSFAHFNGAGTHWHHDYDNSIKRATKDMEKYQEKISKNPGHKNMMKWMQSFKYEVDTKRTLTELVERLDSEMEKQKIKLIEENNV